MRKEDFEVVEAYEQEAYFENGEFSCGVNGALLMRIVNDKSVDEEDLEFMDNPKRVKVQVVIKVCEVDAND